MKKRTRKAFGIRKKEKDTDSTGSPDRDGTNSPELDEEGYSIRPEEPGYILHLLSLLVQRVTFHALIVFLFNCDLPTKGKHFYSSSESEEEEEAHKKFNIKIKPLQSKDILKSAATVDELKASIGNIALSPSPVVSKTLFNFPLN
ncbi:hypothetical protein lerEdw1_011788 [Lerista edwardsae]|nr:hypothetical protein lerEdw1_011788 [Lerista edwardsae]